MVYVVALGREGTSYGEHRLGFIIMNPGSSITFKVAPLPILYMRPALPVSPLSTCPPPPS